jgi:hypothetical protein
MVNGKNGQQGGSRLLSNILPGTGSGLYKEDFDFGIFDGESDYDTWIKLTASGMTLSNWDFSTLR